ncbi:AAA family ATPase [Secundilactobacillus kimchicus]|uniref:RNA ligase n=1 Tax=Secundilactobacillus kimchicus TaxID=528209 RepID=UPI001C01E1B7|nr:RNA ligase [Secundilactobacillus kimchicus]MBT9670474.1 AAA family ATPase [Secundilactobacillus kimchicus]
MRKLVVLVGAPAVGKSTWIFGKSLEPYTLSTDDLRQLLSQPVTFINDDNDGVHQNINWKVDHRTWELLDQLLEERMKQGQTVFVDATHLFSGALSRYKKLTAKYHYDTEYIDFMAPFLQQAEQDGNDPVAVLEKQDGWRGTKITDSNIFKKYLRRYQNVKESLYAGHKGHVFTPDEFSTKFLGAAADEEPISLDAFDTIKIVGDIHGDYSNLDKLMNDHHKGTAYIFVGDYLDRGSKNAETFKLLAGLRGKNIFFLRGNHEQRMESWVYNHEKRGQFGRDTLVELLKAGITDEDMDNFVAQLKDYLYFTYHGASYMVTHAGIDPVWTFWQRRKEPYFLQSDNFFTEGLSKENQTPYERDIDIKALSEYVPHPFNIHGHRNEFEDGSEERKELMKAAKTVNLTQAGKFMYTTLTESEAFPHTHTLDRIDVPSKVQEIFNDPDVKEIELPDGLVSHNFTKEVFREGRWTPNTMMARGLFTDGDKIVGRGFDKFFNVGENKSATLDSLHFPVKVYEKHNGFLALAFIRDHKLVIETKSGLGYTDSDHTKSTSDSACDIIYGDEKLLLQMVKVLKKYPDTTIALEVIAPEDGDFHILHYVKNQAIPLAVIHNQTGKFCGPAEELLGIKPQLIANDRKELDKYLAGSNRIIHEGVVLRGTNKLLKAKSDYYLAAKELRTAMAHGGKSVWYHGGQRMFEYAQSVHQKKFTPEFALEAYQVAGIGQGEEQNEAI